MVGRDVPGVQCQMCRVAVCHGQGVARRSPITCRQRRRTRYVLHHRYRERHHSTVVHEGMLASTIERGKRQHRGLATLPEIHIDGDAHDVRREHTRDARVHNARERVHGLLGWCFPSAEVLGAVFAGIGGQQLQVISAEQGLLGRRFAGTEVVGVRAVGWWWGAWHGDSVWG